MDYGDAMKMVTMGMKLRRTHGHRKDEYVYLAGKILTHRCESGRLETYLPTEDDQRAGDWELVR